MLKPPRENSIDEVLGRVWAKVLSVARECLFGACAKALQVQNSVKRNILQGFKRNTSHSYVTCRKRGKHVWISFHSLKKVDTNALIADLNRIPWSILDTCSNDPDEMLNTWIKLVLDVVDTHAPMKKKGVKSPDKPSWLMNEIQEAIKHRGHLKKTTRSWKHSKSYF